MSSVVFIRCLRDSIKRQVFSLESGVQADRSSPQETGLKGREMLRNVMGEIEHSDNGSHLLSAASETKPSALRSLQGASAFAASVISFGRAPPHQLTGAHTCGPKAAVLVVPYTTNISS